jgi:hypothetical protein
MSQFHALREKDQWTDTRAWEEKDFLCTAIAKDFGMMFGTDKDCLEAWQTICRTIGIVSIPSEISSCKSVSTSTPHGCIVI